MFSIVLAGVAGVLIAGMPTVMAHHAFGGEFDANRPVLLKGKVVKVELVNPHAWIHIAAAEVTLAGEKKDLKGQTEEWAVEGDSIDKMRVAGYSDDIVRMGAIIRVHGFRAKPGANVVDTIAGPRRGALARVMDLAKAGRIMYCTQITLADGKNVPFGSAAGGFRPEPPNSPGRFR